MINTRANRYPSPDSPRAGFRISGEAAGLLNDTRTDHDGNKATLMDPEGRAVSLHHFYPPTLTCLYSPDPADAGAKESGEEAAIAKEARIDNVENQVLKFKPHGCPRCSVVLCSHTLTSLGKPDLKAARIPMSDLGSFAPLHIIGRAKPTLANVLSARFPELRRMISSDLNMRDRLMMLMTCHNLRDSLNSQDHLSPFVQYFTAHCESKIPRWHSCFDSTNLPHYMWMPCHTTPHTPFSDSVRSQRC